MAYIFQAFIERTTASAYKGMYEHKETCVCVSICVCMFVSMFVINSIATSIRHLALHCIDLWLSHYEHNVPLSLLCA